MFAVHLFHSPSGPRSSRHPSQLQTRSQTPSGQALTFHPMSILVQVMEEKVTDVNVDVATVRPQEGFKLYSKEEVADVIGRI